MYLSLVSIFSLRNLCALALSVTAWASPVCAGWQWGLPEGGTTLKFLSLPLSPRTAALGGAGLASPVDGSGQFVSPLASSAVQEPTLGFTQVQLAERIGGSLSAVDYVLPLGTSLHLHGGMEYLGYDDLQGRDENGLATGSYGAGAYALQLGSSGVSGPLYYGITGRFAHQSIDGYGAMALLGDAGLGFRVNPYFSFAAAVTNWGWVEPYDGYAESAPLAVQAGTSVKVPLRPFAISLHGDLYRRADSKAQVLTGLELEYQHLLSLRLGYPFRDGENGLSAGLGLKAGPLGFSYAYASRPALKGNHHFGVSLAF